MNEDSNHKYLNKVFKEHSDYDPFVSENAFQKIGEIRHKIPANIRKNVVLKVLELSKEQNQFICGYVAPAAERLPEQPNWNVRRTYALTMSELTKKLKNIPEYLD